MKRYRFSNIEFTWDEHKALLSSRKHGVRFEEAATVFADPPTLWPASTAIRTTRKPRPASFWWVIPLPAECFWWFTPRKAIQFVSSVPAERPPGNGKTTKPMREQYELKQGRPNPYAARLGAKGRDDLVRWWSSVTDNVRVLPSDVAREFPDTPTTVEALRLVMKLREVKPTDKPGRKRRTAA